MADADKNQNPSKTDLEHTTQFGEEIYLESSGPAEQFCFSDDYDMSLDQEGKGEEKSDQGVTVIEDAVHPRANLHPASVSETVELELLDLCREIGAPLNAYDKIMKWAGKANATGHKFTLSPRCRSTVVDGLFDRLNLHGIKPKTTNVQLEGGQSATVTHFDFKEMVMSLLNSRELMQEENLVLPPGNICGTFPPNTPLGEINTGSWFWNAHQKLHKKDNDFICPVIPFINKTGTDNKNKLSVKEVVFTLSIYKNSVQNNPKAWRPLGIVKNMIKSEATPNKHKSQGKNHRNYHTQMEFILKSLRECQEAGGFVENLWIGNRCYRVHFKFPVGPLLGDCEGHDVQCMQHKGHNCNSICRDCDCSMADADNPDVQCNYLKQADMAKLVDDQNWDRLQELSHYRSKPCWHKMCMGGDLLGIHGMTPPEILHFYQKGHFHHAVLGLLDNSTEGVKARIDQLVADIVVFVRHQSSRDFPPVNFPRGITSLKNLTCMEHTGVVFMHVLLLNCDKGKKIFVDAQKTTGDNLSPKEAGKFCDLFEQLLCFYDWM